MSTKNIQRGIEQRKRMWKLQSLSKKVFSKKVMEITGVIK